MISSNQGTRALITGGSGMIGAELASQLVSQRVSVRCLLRPSSNSDRLNSMPVEVLRVDFQDETSIAKAMSGITHVYHVAGYLHAGSPFNTKEDYTMYQAANVDITSKMLSASLAAGVKKFLFASTVAVYDPKVQSPIKEDSPVRPLSSYGRSKLEAEELVKDYGRRGLNITIVRPSATYGPSDRHFLPLALSIAQKRRILLIDGGCHLVDFVYVGDVARLMIVAAHSPDSCGRTYNSGSGEPQPLRSFFHTYASLIGQSTPEIFSIPSSLCRSLGPLLRIVVRLFAPEMGSLLTPESIVLLSRDVSYDMSLAATDLNFRPQIDFSRGLSLALKL